MLHHHLSFSNENVSRKSGHVDMYPDIMSLVDLGINISPDYITFSIGYPPSFFWLVSSLAYISHLAG